MPKRRSSTGRDYRTKELKDSPFAPKNGGSSPHTVAMLLPGLIFIGFVATKNFPRTMEGLAVFGGLLFVVYLLCLIQVLRWERRRIDAKQKKANTPAAITMQDDTFTFDDHASQGIDAPMNMPKAFEHEIAQLIQSSTGKRTRVVGGAGDGGVDIEVFGPDGRVVGIVQCKAYLKGKALPPAPVRELYAVKIQRGVNSAYLVTTAHVTDGTRQEAEKLGVRIIDGAAIARMREKQRVQSKPVTAPTVVNQRVVIPQSGIRNMWEDN
jgi:hypothetical protein